MGVSWELHWKKELLFLRTKMWRVATLWLALAGLELISGSPLPVSQKNSPSSSNAKEEWFKSDSPGQKQPSEAQFPKSDAIKESSNTNSEGSAQKKSDSSDPVEKEEPNAKDSNVDGFPEASAVKGASSYGGGSASVGGAGLGGGMSDSAAEAKASASNAAQTVQAPKADAVVDPGASSRQQMKNRMSGSLKELDAIDQGDNDEKM